MKLTAQEQRVLTLRTKGKTQVAIAKQLDISQAAVSSFEKNAKRKLYQAQATLDLAKAQGYEIPEELP